MDKRSKKLHSSEENALKIDNLSKSFGDKNIFHNLNLEIKPGSFVGLFGLNGAGKSTLLNCVANNLVPDQGSIKIMGYDVQDQHVEASRFLGIMQQQPDMDPRMSAIHTLAIQGELYGMPYNAAWERGMELLKVMELDSNPYLKPMNMSGGMRQRLMMAKAMMHSPKLLILDEPTAGVDFKASEAIYQYIKHLNQVMGTTIVLTTHVIDKIALLCKKLIFLKEGNIRILDNVKLGGGYIAVLSSDRNLKSFNQHREKDKRIQSLSQNEKEIFFQMNFSEAMQIIHTHKLDLSSLKQISGVEASIMKNI